VTSDEIDNIIERTGDLEATVVILKGKLKELVGGSYSTARHTNMNRTEEGANSLPTGMEPVYVVNTTRHPNMNRTEEGANSLPTGMEPVYVVNTTNNSLSQHFGRQCEESPRLYCFVVCTRVFNMKSR